MKKTLVLSFLLVLTLSAVAQASSLSGNPDFDRFLADWEKAQNLFINGDPTLWKRHCSRRDDTTILGGFGGFGEKGWAAVGARYDWASSQYKSGGATMKVEYISVTAGDGLAYTVGIERQTEARVGSAGPVSRALRVTQIFRKEDGAWKLVHRHADPLVEKQAPSTPPRQSFREGSGPAIVMLGGGVYGAAMFEQHAKLLSGDFEVIRVQALNVQAAETGEAIPGDYSIAQEAGALRETLRAIGVRTPVHIVGSSLGALVALEFTLAHPELVRSAVLFEPPVFSAIDDSDPAKREIQALTSRMTASATPTDEDFVRFRCVLGKCPVIPGATDAARPEWDRQRRAMRGMAAVATYRLDPSRLERVRLPVLLLTGSETIPFHRRIAEALARGIPQAKTGEIRGGHTAALTSPDEFVRVLREFVARTGD
jgi:pimeloyl-ACP methyl ester carboxylesterase